MLVKGRASDALAGGADSPVRSGWAVGGEPFVQARGAGAYAYDAAGRRYIDYVMAYGPLLFGHGIRRSRSGLDAIAARGAVTGSTHPDELLLAERIRGHLPSMERLRFATTGSEAVQGADPRRARLHRARAILKFAGNYHGHFDLALQDAGASAHTDAPARSGIPRARDARRSGGRALQRSRRRRRAPRPRSATGSRRSWSSRSSATWGSSCPMPGFLEGLRRARRRARRAADLRRDHHLAAPRTRRRARRVRNRPDLTTVGKILGGGFPLAAFGGRADVMAVLAPDGPCFTGGTHAGNPFAVAIGLRVLDWLEAHPESYARMDALAQRLAAGIRAVLAQARARLCRRAAREHRRLQVSRRGRPTRNYDDARRADTARVRRLLSRDARARHPAAAVAERSDVPVHRAHRGRRRRDAGRRPGIN